jgi:hypothetical protein
MKWLQLGLLAVIAATLLWSGESVRSFPARVFNGPRPAELDEGRRALESGNYALAAALLTRAIERSRRAHRREAAVLLAEVRLAQGYRGSALEVPRQYAPTVTADSFLAAHPHRRSALVRAMDCDLGEESLDSADARWCERYVQYLRTHPHASKESAIIAASGGSVDSTTAAQLREVTAWWRSYCARTYGRPGEYEPYQRGCRERGLVR